MINLSILENSINYTCQVVRIKEIIDIPEADLIKQTIINNNSIIIGNQVKVNDLMLYFVSNTKLNSDLCKQHNLYSNSELNADTTKKGYIDKTGRTSFIKLRNTPSNGLLLPLSVLDMFDESWSKELKENDTFNCINDIVICEKYIVRNQTSNTVKKEGKRKNKIKVEKLKIDSFKEHKDTVHFFKHLHSFNDNDVITITEKYHGTSIRFGDVHCTKNLSKFNYLVQKWMSKLFGYKFDNSTYEFIVGSRKVIKNKSKIINPINWNKLSIEKRKNLLDSYFENKVYNNNDYNNILYTEDIEKFKSFYNYVLNNVDEYYGDDLWIKACYHLRNKLPKDLIFYGEIVGYNGNKSIMPTYDNKHMGKEFIKKYGTHTVFNYGLEQGEFALIIYRISRITSDNELVDLSHTQMEQLCDKLGLMYPTCIYHGTVGDIKKIYGKTLEEYVKSMMEQTSLSGNHISEGFVIEKECYPTNNYYKAKNELYCLLEDRAQANEIPNIEDEN